MQERRTEEHLYPSSIPVFEMGKPVHQKQLAGLVNYLRTEIFIGVHYSIGCDRKRGIVAIGETVEPINHGFRVDVTCCKIPREPRLVINAGKFSYDDMAKMLTFADNALSWGDSIAMNPLPDSQLELVRACNHDKQCVLGKRPVASKIIAKVRG